MIINAAICTSRGLHCISCVRSIKIIDFLGGSPQKIAVLNKLKMSERHFRCLCLFVEKKGEVIKKDTIIEHVWYGSVIGPSSLGVLIYELRAMLNVFDFSIITVRGKGYIMTDNIEGLFE